MQEPPGAAPSTLSKSFSVLAAVAAAAVSPMRASPPCAESPSRLGRNLSLPPERPSSATQGAALHRAVSLASYRVSVSQAGEHARVGRSPGRHAARRRLASRALASASGSSTDLDDDGSSSSGSSSLEAGSLHLHRHTSADGAQSGGASPFEQPRHSSDTDTTAQSAVDLSPSERAGSSWLGLFAGATAAPVTRALSGSPVCPTSPTAPDALPRSPSRFSSLHQLFWSPAPPDSPAAPAPRKAPTQQLDPNQLDAPGVAHPASHALLDLVDPAAAPAEAARAASTAAASEDAAAATADDDGSPWYLSWVYRGISSASSVAHAAAYYGTFGKFGGRGSHDGGGAAAAAAALDGVAVTDAVPTGGAHAATPASGTCPHIAELVPDRFLFQVAALLGEPVHAGALGQEAGQPLACGGASLLGAAEHLKRSPEASWRFARVGDNADERLGVRYTVERRLQRSNANTHRTELRIAGARAAQVRAFVTSDEVQRRAAAVLALDRLAVPGRDGAHAREGDCAIYHNAVQLPKPIGRRQYVYARRVWDRAEDAGFYSVHVPAELPEGAARVAATKGGHITDFRGGYCVRCAMPCPSFRR